MTNPSQSEAALKPIQKLARWFTLTPRTAILLAAGLLCAALLLAVQNDRIVLAEKTRQASVQAQILAASVAAPLAFDDRTATQEYVHALRTNPDVKAAGAYDARGRLVSSFSSPGLTLPSSNRVGEPTAVGGDLIISQQVKQGDTKLGSVYLRTSLESWARRAMRYIGIALIILMASLLIAVLGSSYASLRDAHRKLQAEIEIREQAEEALRQAQKMEAMGQLTGGVAHDFNNLLMVASSGLDLMERTNDAVKIERLKSGIRQAVERGAKLTQQLLTFARKSPMHPEVVDVGERIRGMDTLLDRSLGEHIQIENRIAPELWPIEVDPSQFEVALLNIVLNARDAMPKGGSITISAENMTADESAPARVQISISDTGIGIDPEMRAKIFEPFFTTKGVGQGTGLGLSQVYGFARSSGGDVQVESELGIGTTISILIPRSDKPLVIREEDPKTRSVSRTQQRVLLVEDDDHVAEMVAEMLDTLGYQSERAPTADEAITTLERGMSFDILLSDMVMPGQRSGLDLVREISRRWPKLPALLMTGYSAAAASATNENLRLLLKPFALEDLSAQLEAISANGRNRA